MILFILFVNLDTEQIYKWIKMVQTHKWINFTLSDIICLFCLGPNGHRRSCQFFLSLLTSCWPQSQTGSLFFVFRWLIAAPQATFSQSHSWQITSTCILTFPDNSTGTYDVRSSWCWSLNQPLNMRYMMIYWA